MNTFSRSSRLILKNISIFYFCFFQVSPVGQQQMFLYAQHGLQVLPGLRELQLQGLHHREVLRQRPGVRPIE